MCSVHELYMETICETSGTQDLDSWGGRREQKGASEQILKNNNTGKSPLNKTTKKKYQAQTGKKQDETEKYPHGSIHTERLPKESTLLFNPVSF